MRIRRRRHADGGDRAPSEQEGALPVGGGHQGGARGDDGQGGAGRAEPVRLGLVAVVVVLVAAGIAFYNQGRRYGGRLPHPHIGPKRNALLSFASPPRWEGSRNSGWRWPSGWALVLRSRDRRKGEGLRKVAAADPRTPPPAYRRGPFGRLDLWQNRRRRGSICAPSRAAARVPRDHFLPTDPLPTVPQNAARMNLCKHLIAF